MKIHSGDIVQVVAGKSKWKSWKVLKVIADSQRVLVEGVNIVKRHMKKSAGTPGQIVESERTVHISNVALIDPETKKPTRVGYTFKNGKKLRIAKKSGKTL